jgi:hypothetical protein
VPLGSCSVPAPAPAGRSSAELPVLHSCRSSGYCSSHLLHWQVVLRRLALPLVSFHPTACLRAPANIPSARTVPIIFGSLLCPDLAFTPVLLDGCLASAAVCAFDAPCPCTVCGLVRMPRHSPRWSRSAGSTSKQQVAPRPAAAGTGGSSFVPSSSLSFNPSFSRVEA